MSITRVSPALNLLIPISPIHLSGVSGTVSSKACYPRTQYVNDLSRTSTGGLFFEIADITNGHEMLSLFAFKIKVLIK